jgi:hypothetical protein
MLTMQRIQKEGIRTYEQAAKNLKSLNVTPEFDTPKHHVKILSMQFIFSVFLGIFSDESFRCWCYFGRLYYPRAAWEFSGGGYHPALGRGKKFNCSHQ